MNEANFYVQIISLFSFINATFIFIFYRYGQHLTIHPRKESKHKYRSIVDGSDWTPVKLADESPQNGFATVTSCVFSTLRHIKIQRVYA